MGDDRFGIGTFRRRSLRLPSLACTLLYCACMRELVTCSQSQRGPTVQLMPLAHSSGSSRLLTERVPDHGRGAAAAHFPCKGAITNKIKHAIKHKTTLKQVLQDLHNCCTTVAALISILL